MRQPNSLMPVFCCLLYILGCTPARQLQQQARRLVQQPELAAAHTGICLQNLTTGKTLYHYQGNKYFIPASNNKLFTCYAAVRYLGDSLETGRYLEDEQFIYLQPAGDPTFLHNDFTWQPLYAFLQHSRKPVVVVDSNWQSQPLGAGWAWDDYERDYLPERSALPLYGNLLTLQPIFYTPMDAGSNDFRFTTTPASLRDSVVYPGTAMTGIQASLAVPTFHLQREKDRNSFTATRGKPSAGAPAIPFVTRGCATAIAALQQLLGNRIRSGTATATLLPGLAAFREKGKVIYSQPTDSLLQRMMYRSDNFYAEQTLLMVSHRRLGLLNEAAIIDTLLQTDLNDLPQKPRWVDGSGLSRYNLVTPADLVQLLSKLYRQAGWQRLTQLLPGANQGTLAGYYRQLEGHIFAKTGTLSNHLALSGYLVTRKKHTLAFSVLVNNHQSNATAIRRRIEAFLYQVYEKE